MASALTALVLTSLSIHALAVLLYLSTQALSPFL